MPLRLGSLGLFFSLVAIALAANYADQERAKTTRSPASLAAMHKEEVLGAFRDAPGLKHTEKLRGPLSVKIELVGEVPKVGETYVLRGTITSRKPLDSAGFTWAVPNNASVINGSVSGQVQNVTAETPAVVELTLKKLTDENQQVHLMASAIKGEIRFGDSAQFNTDSQSMLTGATKTAVLGKDDDDDVHASASEKAGGPSSELKVFH